MKSKYIVLAILGAFAAPAQSIDLGSENLNITGFGTLAAAKPNTDEARFTRYNQREGATDSFTIGLDTNLGLQATYTFSDRLSGTVQVLSRKSTGDTYTTDLTWAFLKYRVSDEVSARLGRVVLPAFLISDYQSVGYANTMMRPPIEMYAQNPIENVDGVDLSWQRTFGDTNFSAQVFVGISRGKSYVSSDNSVAKYHAPAAGFALTAEHGPFTLRLGHAQGKIKSDNVGPINSLTNTLTAVGFGQLASDITLREKKRVAFTSVGLSMDWNNIVVQSEYGQRRAKDPVYLADSDAWYVMGGYRLGKFLPYYAHSNYDGKGSNIALPTNFPTSGALATTVRYALAPSDQKSDLVGVRWDFAKSAALKVQVDRVKPGAKGGFLIGGPTGGLKDTVTVVAAGVDFVF